MSDKKPTLHQKELDKQRSIEEKLKKEAADLKKEYTQKTLGLLTSGFGVVAALAWNDVVKEVVNIYIKPLFGEGTGVISLLIYAILVTALVVFVTFQLSKFGPEEKKEKKK